MSLHSDFWSNLKTKKKNEKKKTTPKQTTRTTSKTTARPTTAKTTTVSNPRKKTSNLSSDFWANLTVDDIAPTVTAKKKTDDIAPVKKDERKWFQKGALEGGFQMSDIPKLFFGSTADVSENLSSGIIGMGEKALDALATLAPYAENAMYLQNGGDLYHKQREVHDKVVEQSKKDIAKFVAKDLYDEEKIAKKIISGTTFGYDYESDSVFGEKSDSLVQSGGQLLGTAALQAAGVPWFLTTGTTAFGSEAENALNQGATYEEAALSATISAGAEILTEIHHVIRNIQKLCYATSIIYCRKTAAATLFFLGKDVFFLPNLHGNTDDIIALFF